MKREKEVKDTHDKRKEELAKTDSANTIVKNKDIDFDNGAYPYPPAEDSELLLKAALDEVKKEDEVLEVGVGSGIISSNLMGKCRSIIGTDISPVAVKVSSEKGFEVIRTDIARGIRKKFTLILFNPPYLELEEFEKKGEWIERAIDGGKEGVEITLRFLNEITEVLEEGGRILLLITSENLPHVIKKVHELDLKYKVKERAKFFFEELLVLRIKRSRD